MRARHLRVAPPPGDLQVAIYARVSSDQQAERHTIDSQLAELKARAMQDGLRSATTCCSSTTATAAPV